MSIQRSYMSTRVGSPLRLGAENFRDLSALALGLYYCPFIDQTEFTLKQYETVGWTAEVERIGHTLKNLLIGRQDMSLSGTNRDRGQATSELEKASAV